MFWCVLAHIVNVNVNKLDEQGHKAIEVLKGFAYEVLDKIILCAPD